VQRCCSNVFAIAIDGDGIEVTTKPQLLACLSITALPTYQ
jgi:hypothetical protein